MGIDRDSTSRAFKPKFWLSAGVSCNLLLLGVFKYANFITRNINSLFGSLSIPQIEETNIVLPIGISFYTFHSISYLLDIYRKKCTAQRNISDLALYISMFSQLVAGPIIRYNDVFAQLKNRNHSVFLFSSGIERFLIGLGKKVLLANTFASVADHLFKFEPSHIGPLNAWFALVCYTLQIYCDFAGYSDMAIGLGRMFGFVFKENFNFPYRAQSIKEFWRRWHISLSSFFRDYVYIPLGGNRVGKKPDVLKPARRFFTHGLLARSQLELCYLGAFTWQFYYLGAFGLRKIS